MSYESHFSRNAIVHHVRTKISAIVIKLQTNVTLLNALRHSASSAVCSLRRLLSHHTALTYDTSRRRVQYLGRGSYASAAIAAVFCADSGRFDNLVSILDRALFQLLDDLMMQLLLLLMSTATRAVKLAALMAADAIMTSGATVGIMRLTGPCPSDVGFARRLRHAVVQRDDFVVKIAQDPLNFLLVPDGVLKELRLAFDAFLAVQLKLYEALVVHVILKDPKHDISFHGGP